MGEYQEYREQTNVEQDRQAIAQARARGRWPLFRTYLRLSGPGFLQSAITLGGGTLGTGLYLGVVGGYSMLWVQPLAMILGIIMLSSIGYVTLSTGRRPFALINRELNPVLGWGWALAALAANLCWILPQFVMANEAVRLNLLPGVFGGMSEGLAKGIITVLIAVGAIFVAWSYGQGGRGVRIFELILKLIVALIVVAFVGVVLRIGLAGEIGWGAIVRGMIPNLRELLYPVLTYTPYLEQVDSAGRAYWESLILTEQRNFIISSAAVAVGINMTFLFPYSLIKRGWDAEFRGMAIFDLAAGLFIPFMIVTACIVVAAASQFHANPTDLTDSLGNVKSVVEMPADFRAFSEGRLAVELGAERVAAMREAGTLDEAIDAMPLADRQLATMLMHRKTNDLALTLSPLIGNWFANFLFGLGVIAMGISTAIIIMVINGFVFCEIFGRPGDLRIFRLGVIVPWIGGTLAPFFWGHAAPYLTIPVSMFGAAIMPIAYFTFVGMMNSPRVLGEHMPRGMTRFWWNLLLGIAMSISLVSSMWTIYSNQGRYFGIQASTIGFTLFGLFIGGVIIVHLLRSRSTARN